MLEIDGTLGEGGGQVLRSSLSLSLITQTPFTLQNIRAKRRNGGLGKQHLACVRAAAEISGATVTGDFLGSKKITFLPKPVQAGTYTFSVGSAGSTSLVLQTVLLPLLLASSPSTVTIFGGTHNQKAPTADFLLASFFPLLKKMGYSADLTLAWFGFYPLGGGKIVATMAHRKAPHEPLTFIDPGPLNHFSASVLSAHRPLSVIESQAQMIATILPSAEVTPQDVVSAGPGGAVMVRVHKEHHTEVFSGFSQRDIPATITAKVAAQRALQYAEHHHFAGPHLTDQLLLPLLFAGGGSFTCDAPTLHATTNAEIIRLFTNAMISWKEVEPHLWLCDIRP